MNQPSAELRPRDHKDLDRKYFLKRAEAELEMAQGSMQADAVRCHYELAGLYLDLAYNDRALEDWKLTRRIRPPLQHERLGAAPAVIRH